MTPCERARGAPGLHTVPAGWQNAPCAAPDGAAEGPVARLGPVAGHFPSLERSREGGLGAVHPAHDPHLVRAPVMTRGLLSEAITLAVFTARMRWMKSA